LALVALVGALTLYSAAPTEAAFMAYICDDAACDGAGDTIVTDEGAGDGLSGIDGAILLTGSAGGYEVVVNTSQSKPILPNGGMDLNYTATNIAGGVAGTVWLYAMDTNFSGPNSLSGLIGGTQDAGTVTGIICGGDNNDDPRNPVNAPPCISASDSTGGLTAIGLGPFSASADPYSLTIGVSVTGLGNGQTATGDFRLVPEPASIALFGLGLATFAAYRRRRMQQ
jgi:hypothetical protein